jgi:hypothetical protein
LRNPNAVAFASGRGSLRIFGVGGVADRGYGAAREQIDWFLLASLLENQRVDEEEAILDEAMENLTEATQRLRAIRNLLWATGVDSRVNYRDLAHRVSSALAMTEAAYLEARRRRSKH